MRHPYFIGIGGYGMSALARVFLDMGYEVSGADVRPSERTRRLMELGAHVYTGHRPEQIEGADLIVYSTDVPGTNPELQAARRKGIPIWHRSELLAYLLNQSRGIAVTGTHGKTTTTAMIAAILLEGEQDPTVLVGGEVDFLGGNARLGEGPHVVAECCESDGSFLRYHPQIAVVTNVEPEHLEHYGGSFERMTEAFGQFLAGIDPAGLAVLSSDDPILRRLAERVPGRVLFYGLGREACWTATDISYEQGETRFTVVEAGRPLGELRLSVPGRHNILNALAATAVGHYLSIDFAVMSRALERFHGAKRRYQVLAQANGVTVVDDYAHHPTEIRAVLQAARQRTQGRLLAVFQPQRYVRTRNLMGEFSRAFGEADEVILASIYSPPGEEPIPGVSSEVLARLIEEQDGRPVHCFPSLDGIADFVLDLAAPGDTILTMGAGDIWRVGLQIAERLKAAAQAS